MGKRIPRTGMRSSGFRKQGRAKVFRARVEPEAAQASALAALKERLFQGSTPMLLAGLCRWPRCSFSMGCAGAGTRA